MKEVVGLPSEKEYIFLGYENGNFRYISNKTLMMYKIHGIHDLSKMTEHSTYINKSELKFIPKEGSKIRVTYDKPFSVIKIEAFVDGKWTEIWKKR